MTETAEVDLRGQPVTVAVETKLDRAFWTRWVPNGWEADTLDFVKSHAEPGSVFLDIGAWIGPISLMAAACGARVIALEPDPVAFRSLKTNVALNEDLPGSIEALQSGFDTKPGHIKIYGNHRGFGTSGSTAVNWGWRSVKVPATTAEDLIAKAGGGRPVAMKVDIEAYEYSCAPELAKVRSVLDATMHLSLHPMMLEKALGWRQRWFGDMREELLSRTTDLIAAFDDCALEALDDPKDIRDPAVLRKRMIPETGEQQEIILIAYPNGGLAG